MNQQASVTEYFSRHPEKYARSYDETTAEGYSFRVRKDRLLEFLGTGSGRVLDIGCGPAVMAGEIAGRGWRYDGIDVSEKMILEARKRFPNVSFWVGSVENIASPKNAYDTIVAMGLVEYLDDLAAIQEMKRVLKPGGRLLVSLPNFWSPQRMWDRHLIAPLSKVLSYFRRGKNTSVSHREYRSASFCRLLKQNGFHIERVVYYNFRLLPRPFDCWLPSLAVITAKALEPLRFTPMRFWGTGFIVEGTKEMI